MTNLIDTIAQRFGDDIRPYYTASITKEEFDALCRMIEKLEKSLLFYADPETYLGIGFFADPPCGELMTDFEELEGYGEKPGKRARESARDYLKLIRFNEEPPHD